MQDCIFCKIAAGQVPSKKVYEDKRLFAFEDINPQAPVHVVIIPKQHLETLLEIGDAHNELLGSIVTASSKIARKQGIAQSGFRLVANCNKDAGQSVFHIHFHLLGGRPMAWPPG
ncbi:MAG: histidine triad nucleotide-binding protein [Candidatus Tectomicrobia bacterium]|uniref:Histidine triad nucleotide-binding protein n=1 Tax=Tectimicrobiota bacterium TaxID=2528274 RepID=A0A932MR76_UNCTE|nr:histidine triad nucleotide-binding protein [Candidatus Tectomicrobia bacterium]